MGGRAALRTWRRRPRPSGCVCCATKRPGFAGACRSAPAAAPPPPSRVAPARPKRSTLSSPLPPPTPTPPRHPSKSRPPKRHPFKSLPSKRPHPPTPATTNRCPPFDLFLIKFSRVFLSCFHFLLSRENKRIIASSRERRRTSILHHRFYHCWFLF